MSTRREVDFHAIHLTGLVPLHTGIPIPGLGVTARSEVNRFTGMRRLGVAHREESQKPEARRQKKPSCSRFCFLPADLWLHFSVPLCLCGSLNSSQIAGAGHERTQFASG